MRKNGDIISVLGGCSPLHMTFYSTQKKAAHNQHSNMEKRSLNA
ncbi:hypothetical protein [Okeania sp. SIO2C2]|nr:hypothetical protein [Okeania sp. SIO2C2]